MVQGNFYTCRFGPNEKAGITIKIPSSVPESWALSMNAEEFDISSTVKNKCHRGLSLEGRLDGPIAFGLVAVCEIVDGHKHEGDGGNATGCTQGLYHPQLQGIVMTHRFSVYATKCIEGWRWAKSIFGKAGCAAWQQEASHRVGGGRRSVDEPQPGLAHFTTLGVWWRDGGRNGSEQEQQMGLATRARGHRGGQHYNNTPANTDFSSPLFLSSLVIHTSRSVASLIFVIGRLSSSA
ncbi:unnamed protein product [Pleuronectes platessa]|uniref:Uncharacterized protein n=1 Tax=Pleuronectes platessa TaxID=8262 RepID=A0A9N7Z964_PLEPL|nr:unnamed protein product [Pleuronectes platessa]